jgi:flagellin
MSTINPSIPSAYKSYLTDTQSQINLIKTQLNTGKKITTPAEQSTITTLSNAVSSASAVTQSINDGQKTIASAQKRLTSIASLLNQMQILANQATNPSLSNLDAIDLNRRFQLLVTDMGKIATSAGVNGVNLLSGSAGLNIKTGIDNTPASRMHVDSVNIYGMMMMGSMSGIRLESSADANSAVGSIRSAIATVSNGQAMLNSMSKQLSIKSDLINAKTANNQAQLNSLQNIDKPALQTQLNLLNSKLSVYTLLSKLG